MNQGVYETVPCNVCGSNDYRVLIRPTVTDIDPQKVMSASGGVMGTQQIVECQQCGLAYVNPRLRSEMVIRSYNQASDELYVAGGPGRERTFARCAKLIERWRKPPGRLLDVGCAAGFFVRQARLRGWEACGIEPCSWLVDWGKEHLKEDLRAGTLAEASLRDGEFDVVTMWDVLEHVPDPMSQLRECFRVLKPGGLLVINYPDFGSVLARLAGRRWWFLLSNHLYYFTPRTMSSMLRSAGFRVSKFSMHWQVLSLEHLAKVFHIYSPALSRLGLRMLHILKIGGLPIPYYAAQTNVIALKPHGDQST